MDKLFWCPTYNYINAVYNFHFQIRSFRRIQIIIPNYEFEMPHISGFKH
jgi:hypothetical protein